MGSQENIEVVRQGYEAFGSGDMDMLRKLFAEDVVWHVGGTGGLAGDKQGVEAVISYFGELFARSGGTVKVDVEDMVGGDQHVVGLQRNHAERNGHTSDLHAAIVFTVSGGKVTEAREFVEDTAKSSEFWS